MVIKLTQHIIVFIKAALDIALEKEKRFDTEEIERTFDHETLEFANNIILFPGGAKALQLYKLLHRTATFRAKVFKSTFTLFNSFIFSATEISKKGPDLMTLLFLGFTFKFMEVKNLYPILYTTFTAHTRCLLKMPPLEQKV